MKAKAIELVGEKKQREYDDSRKDLREEGFNQMHSKAMKVVEGLLQALDFYKTRCEALQKAQKEFREPGRTIVCNILANGRSK